MKKLVLSAFVLTMILTNLAASQTNSVLDILDKGKQKPFVNIEAYLSKIEQTFSNDDEVVKLFNQERNRLGANFEAELWKYLGSDFRKHYWTNAFLEVEDYLQGNKPLPQLAFKVREKAVELPVPNDDYEMLGMKFTVLRQFSVDLYLAGKRDLAISYKKKAELIYNEIKDMGVVGATTEFVMCIYDNLEKNPSGCKEEKISTTDDKEGNKSKHSSAGVMNGKAVSLPAPEYPKAAQAVGARGEVNVTVTIDEAGNVISAEAISGHPLLKSAAVEAAKKAKFKPMIVDGQARKVIGTIVYNFGK